VSDVIRSPLLQELGFLHGFSLRTGGTSTGGFASLNLGRAVGDDPERVELNHRRFAQAVGYEPGALFESSQVHGADLRVLSAEDEPAAVRTEEADALLAVHAGAAVGVRVADCVPLLLADVNSGVVAAVHAGWRGTVSGVVEAAFQGLLMAGSGDPSAVVAAIFPHIRRCCFEVGDDVAATLAAASRDHDVVDRSREKPHVDLERVVTAKLLALGVPATRIDRVVGCTRCEPERYFSFRRDGQRSGRHVAAIVARGQIGPRS
jgi:YfiH family protein